MTLPIRSMLAIVTLTAVVAGVAQAQPPVESVHVVLTGGANAGSYDATSTRGGCSAGATGAGSFGNQLSNPKGEPAAFNSLQLIVPNAKAAATGTSEFQVIVGFGPLMKRTAEYTVNTLPDAPKKTGSGKVSVKDGGATAQVTIDAVTSAGVKIMATIDCKAVTRM
jgi:hypothetical protein